MHKVNRRITVKCGQNIFSPVIHFFNNLQNKVHFKRVNLMTKNQNQTAQREYLKAQRECCKKCG